METKTLDNETADLLKEVLSDLNKHEKHRESLQHIIDYYNVAGPDYEFWSKQYNMHFGVYQWGMNPFKREPMLNLMNHEVLQRLHLDSVDDRLVLDMGCGIGTSARYGARQYPFLQFIGLTVVPWQIDQGNITAKKENLDDRVKIIYGDFTEMPLPENYADAAYAIESSCYGSGFDKSDLISEMYRVLREGGRFAITDGFRKHTRKFPWLLQKVYDKMTGSWAIDELGDIHSVYHTLSLYGFKKIKVEEISWRVAPSVMHVPFAIVGFLIKHLIEKGNLKLAKERWDNLTGPLFGMIMGAARNHFGYYIISGEK